MEMLHVSTFETLYSGFKSYARRILGGFLEDSWRIPADAWGSAVVSHWPFRSGLAAT